MTAIDPEVHARALGALERNAEAFGAQKSSLDETTRVVRENSAKIYDKLDSVDSRLVEVGERVDARLEALDVRVAAVEERIAEANRDRRSWSDWFRSSVSAIGRLVASNWKLGAGVLGGASVAGGGALGWNSCASSASVEPEAVEESILLPEERGVVEVDVE